MAQPCIGSSESAFRMSRSSVPWGRSSRWSVTGLPLCFYRSYDIIRPVEAQGGARGRPPPLIARHDEQRGPIEIINRPQPVGVVVLRHVHHLLLRRHAGNRHTVVEPAVDAHRGAVWLFSNRSGGMVEDGYGYMWAM